MNRITLTGTLVADPKARSFEARGQKFEVISLWIEVKDGSRTDRFNVDVNDGKAASAAKDMREGVIVEVTGKLRHDRWKDSESKRWTGKVYVAVDAGEGTVVSKGIAEDAKAAA